MVREKRGPNVDLQVRQFGGRDETRLILPAKANVTRVIEQTSVRANTRKGGPRSVPKAARLRYECQTLILATH